MDVVGLTYFINKDHLGSITQLIDKYGAIIAKFNYTSSTASEARGNLKVKMMIVNNWSNAV